MRSAGSPPSGGFNACIFSHNDLQGIPMKRSAHRTTLIALTAAVSAAFAASGHAEPAERQAYYGDLHLHTSYSFDAYVLFGAKVEPDAAYRFARGESVDFLGSSAKRSEPLYLLRVTDHSE